MSPIPRIELSRAFSAEPSSARAASVTVSAAMSVPAPVNSRRCSDVNVEVARLPTVLGVAGSTW